MFPLNSPDDVRAEYQARVNAALRPGKPVRPARPMFGQRALARLRAWLIEWRGERTQHPQPVDSIS